MSEDTLIARLDEAIHAHDDGLAVETVSKSLLREARAALLAQQQEIETLHANSLVEHELRLTAEAQDVQRGALVELAKEACRTAEERAEQAEAQLREARSQSGILDHVVAAVWRVLCDEPVSDFDKSYAEVRGVVDLKAQLRAAEARVPQLEEAARDALVVGKAQTAHTTTLLGHIAATDEALARLAEGLARLAHYGQKEELTGDAYIHHVKRIVSLVEGADAKAVAWLHDVLEDSQIVGVNPDDKLAAVGFTPAIVDATLLLTRGWYVAHAKGYEAYIDSIRTSSNALAIAVKCADLQDHLRPNCPESLRPRYEKALRALRAGESR